MNTIYSRTISALVASLVVLLSFASAARAGTIAYEVPAGHGGNQAFGGSLGMDFIVRSEISVTSLGVFDDLSDGLNRPLTAQLWSRNDGGTPQAADDTAVSLIETLDFTPASAGMLVGGSRFKPLAAPRTLSPGAYTMVAFGYGVDTMPDPADPNLPPIPVEATREELSNIGGGIPAWSTNDGGGYVEFVGRSRFGTAGAFPGTADGGPPDRYAAGTFEFDTIGPAPPRRTVKIDTTTRGNWIGTYGSDGYVLTAFNGGSDEVSLPDYVSSVTFPGGSRFAWANPSSPTDVRGVQNPNDPAERRATTIFSGGSYEVNVEVNRAVSFQIGIYALDWDGNNARNETISFPDLDIDPEVVTDFTIGKWYLYEVTASPNEPLRIVIENNTSNAVISAVMFDPAAIPEPSTLVLAALGLCGLALSGRRRRQRG